MSRYYLLALVTLLSSAANALDSGFVPPTAVFYHTDFEVPAPVPEAWQIDTGTWSVSDGRYNGNSTGTTLMAASTIAEYSIDPNGAPQAALNAPYTFRARARNGTGNSTTFVGVVFDYIDQQHFKAVLFTPASFGLPASQGHYFVWHMEHSIRELASGPYTGAGENVWFDIEVVRGPDRVLVKVNGVDLADVAAAPESGGRVGLMSRSTTAQFDKVSVAVPVGGQPFKEDFASGLPSWSFDGAWTATDGTLTNTSVQQTNTAFAPDTFIAIAAESTFAYTLRARMLNPYGGPGNLIGLFFNDSGSLGRGEVLFSPTGVARIDLIQDGVRKTIATRQYHGRRNEWFDVRADVSAGRITVAVNRATIFDDVATDPIFEGRGGLVTHWTPGKFDNVWYDNRSTFRRLSATFDSPPPAGWILSGSWNVSGGTLNSVSVGRSDIVTTKCACWETDIFYRARLLNQYGSSGNLAGLVYNYQRLPFNASDPRPYVGLYTGDYYEVVFAPTGEAYMNKVISGVRYRVATGNHSVPQDVWFDVEVHRQGVFTTVKVNGVTVFQRVPQGELTFGDVGVVAHWSKARFDNLSVTDGARR